MLRKGAKGRFTLDRESGFRTTPEKSAILTGAALADYDNDGNLDLYVCSYDFWQAGSEYDTPTPYYDATNGPPNFLFRNRGDGTFEDVTEAAGLMQNNDRFSFAPAFPVLFADERVVNAYTVLNRNLFDRQRDLAIPTSFLLDEKGLIQKVYAGATPSSVILADANAGSGPALPFAGKRLLPMPERDFGAIATAMAERGLNEEARTYFEAALKTGGGGPDVYNNLATLLLTESRIIQ